MPLFYEQIKFEFGVLSDLCERKLDILKIWIGDSFSILRVETVNGRKLRKNSLFGTVFAPLSSYYIANKDIDLVKLLNPLLHAPNALL